MIIFRDVSRIYHIGDTTLRALDHANMHIREGEFVSIIGPSGSGKSTLMNIVGCLDLADEGEYFLDGQEIRKYSEDYWFSAYLFVASGMHVGWMMNGLRQFMAVTIVFSVTPWMLEKKYIRVILIILLASLFHRTALFMIPIIFIAQGEIWNLKTLAFSAVIVGMSLLFSGNIGLFNSFANTTGYSAEFAIELGDNGTNPLRVLVNSVPMLLAFTFRDRLREENDGIINMCVNMSIITSGVYLLSMVTSGILTGRMTIYTSLYNLILLPYVIDTCFLENNVYILRVLTIVLYFVYFAVQWQLR